MRFLNDEQRRSIGFYYILENINTVSKLGEKEKRSIEPYTQNKSEELVLELKNTENIISALEEKSEFIDKFLYLMCKVKDIIPTINKIPTGAVLDEVELFEIKAFSKICIEIFESYKKENISLNFVEFADVKPVFDMLDPEKTGYETFYIYDNYSAELLKLRNKRRNLEQEIPLQKDLEKKNELLFKRTEIISKEEELEFGIREELTNALKEYSKSLLLNSKTIGYLDFLIAKAKYFVSTNAVSPKIDLSVEKINLQNMHNPYYDSVMEKKGADMQRLNLELKKGVTVLTGANMGGKSIAMKTVALNVLLANCAFYVYADDASIPIVEFIYMISEDMQSIDSGLSTFGAEMISLKGIVGASSAKDGLIILDELARGTNPYEGRIIVNSMINLFAQRKSYSFISTHFDGVNLKDATHLQVVGLSRVDFDKLKNLVSLNSKQALSILQKYMDYSIEKIDENDVPKNALQIANLLGLEILNMEGNFSSKE